jgi:hypothetical protein
MKTFEVEGWFRYSDGNEKDFETETIQANNAEEAIALFKGYWTGTSFFRIEVKEI